LLYFGGVCQQSLLMAWQQARGARMVRFHPESPEITQSALSKLRFVADVRKQMHAALSKGNRAAYEADIAPQHSQDGTQAERRAALRIAMEAHPFYRGWSSMLLSSQDLMWRLVGQSVDHDAERMASRLNSLSNAAKGSVTLDPELQGPAYLVDADVHRMPGGYMGAGREAEMRAGALYDLGGAIYQLGIGNKAGGLLNDSRGRTLVAHLRTRFPQIDPARILDMGCGVGHNTVPLAAAFPQAKVFGIDVGAPLLRYAHLRAEGLGHEVHFVQDNAEHTRFEDASFDLVVSQIILHETSSAATQRIIGESRRLLRPGGVAVHLEVPLRAEDGDDFDQVMWLWEQHYNAEPNIAGVMDDDLAGMMQQAGFAEVMLGYQGIPPAGSDESAFTARKTSKSFAFWLVVSGIAA
jgi:ubiquinone/menaquinone biosynthesis C-methylase UbiE